MEMSDFWLLCFDCEEEVEYIGEGLYECPKCKKITTIENTHKVATEYLKEEGGYRK